MVKIRLSRAGAKKHAYYHIIAIDERKQRDGGRVPRRPAVALGGEAKELEDRAGGAAVLAVGHGDEEGGREAHHCDGDGGPAGDGVDPGVEGLDVDEAEGGAGHGDGDAQGKEREG